MFWGRITRLLKLVKRVSDLPWKASETPTIQTSADDVWATITDSAKESNCIFEGLSEYGTYDFAARKSDLDYCIEAVNSAAEMAVVLVAIKSRLQDRIEEIRRPLTSQESFYKLHEDLGKLEAYKEMLQYLEDKISELPERP